MNLEQAAQFVKHPQELDLSHAESLKNLADRHPYTAVYALLYLTALANGKSPDLDDALAKHAYKISDRTRLYHLLTGERESAAAQTAGAAERETAPEVAAPLEIAEAQPAENPVHIEFHPEPQTEETEQEEEPEEEIVRKTEAEIGFDFERVTTAHSMEQFVEIEPAPGTREEESETAPEITEQQLVVQPSESETGAAETAAETTAAAPETQHLRSFGSWLRSGSPQPVVAPKPAEQPAEKTSPDVLIEKFIQEEPKITRNKSEFFSPSRKAKESLNEDAVPVSETLAKIYAAQGNYPKAIHVYHQLMLSIPEKKSFFAIQIEDLKQKITS